MYIFGDITAQDLKTLASDVGCCLIGAVKMHSYKALCFHDYSRRVIFPVQLMSLFFVQSASEPKGTEDWNAEGKKERKNHLPRLRSSAVNPYKDATLSTTASTLPKRVNKL